MITQQFNLFFLQQVIEDPITRSDVESVAHLVLLTFRSRLQARAYECFRFGSSTPFSYGITKMGQHEYDAADESQNVNPCIANPMRTFLASLAKSTSKLSRDFHASLSNRCTITWSFSMPHYLELSMCLAVFFERNNYFIQGVRHMYRSCL
jgi:hypothetical protein